MFFKPIRNTLISPSMHLHNHSASNSVNTSVNQMPREISLIDLAINSNDFNAFDLHSLTKRNSLYFMLLYMFHKFQFEEQIRFNSNKYQRFSKRLQSAYRENPYHNAVHAADVLQNVYHYLFNGGSAQEFLKCTTLDLAAIFIAAAAHDVDHPGNNNLFEIKTKSKLAILYNDQAVLE